jgi:hypothetical protein
MGFRMRPSDHALAFVKRVQILPPVNIAGSNVPMDIRFEQLRAAITERVGEPNFLSRALWIRNKPA